MQSKIKLLNEILGAAVVLLAGDLAIGIKIFGGGFKIFLVNVCRYFRAKILRGALGNDYWTKYP